MATARRPQSLRGRGRGPRRGGASRGSGYRYRAARSRRRALGASRAVRWRAYRARPAAQRDLHLRHDGPPEGGRAHARELLLERRRLRREPRAERRRPLAGLHAIVSRGRALDPAALGDLRDDGGAARRLRRERRQRRAERRWRDAALGRRDDAAPHAGGRRRALPLDGARRAARRWARAAGAAGGGARPRPAGVADVRADRGRLAGRHARGRGGTRTPRLGRAAAQRHDDPRRDRGSRRRGR